MRRTDVLLFGSIFGTLLVLLIAEISRWSFLLFLLKGNWVTMTWMITLTVIIVPVRFFPNTRWAKWWDGTAFPKNVTD